MFVHSSDTGCSQSYVHHLCYRLNLLEQQVPAHNTEAKTLLDKYNVVSSVSSSIACQHTFLAPWHTNWVRLQTPGAQPCSWLYCLRIKPAMQREILYLCPQMLSWHTKLCLRLWGSVKLKAISPSHLSPPPAAVPSPTWSLVHQIPTTPFRLLFSSGLVKFSFLCHFSQSLHHECPQGAWPPCIPLWYYLILPACPGSPLNGAPPPRSPE